MKKRTISAIILILILAPLTIIGGLPFALLAGVITLLVAKEINDLFKFPNLIKILTLVSLLCILYSNFDPNTIAFGIDYKYLNIALLMLMIPIIILQPKKKYTVDDAFKLFGITLLIGLGLNYFILVRNINIKYFMFMILIPIITDTFAYIAGSMIGKHKVSKISPKKSLEGYIVGTLMGTFMMVMYYNTFIAVQKNIIIIILITLALSIAGQIGDLFFSGIKRHYNKKDFSNLIPGHGGVLDRLDSLIFVAITFVLLMNYL